MYPLHMTFYWDICALFIWHLLRRMYPSSYDILLRMYVLLFICTFYILLRHMYPLHIPFTETYVSSSYDILLRRMYPLHITFYWDICILFIWHFTETYVPSSYDILLRRMYPLHFMRRMYPLHITFTETYMYPLHITFCWDICTLFI